MEGSVRKTEGWIKRNWKWQGTQDERVQEREKKMVKEQW